MGKYGVKFTSSVYVYMQHCVTDIMLYYILYHAIENTANQNARKPLYCIFVGIPPNLPIEHRINFVMPYIFYDMV